MTKVPYGLFVELTGSRQKQGHKGQAELAAREDRWLLIPPHGFTSAPLCPFSLELFFFGANNDDDDDDDDDDDVNGDEVFFFSRVVYHFESIWSDFDPPKCPPFSYIDASSQMDDCGMTYFESESNFPSFTRLQLFPQRLKQKFKNEIS
jgi:hypothetical protein